MISRESSYMLGSAEVGLLTWPWELASIYIEVLTEICLFTKQQNIRQKSLIGFHSNIKEFTGFTESSLSNLRGYGILDASCVKSKHSEQGKTVKHIILKCFFL